MVRADSFPEVLQIFHSERFSGCAFFLLSAKTRSVLLVWISAFAAGLVIPEKRIRNFSAAPVAPQMRIQIGDSDAGGSRFLLQHHFSLFGIIYSWFPGDDILNQSPYPIPPLNGRCRRRMQSGICHPQVGHKGILRVISFGSAV